MKKIVEIGRNLSLFRGFDKKNCKILKSGYFELLKSAKVETIFWSKNVSNYVKCFN
jgi:hypothetical protein